MPASPSPTTPATREEGAPGNASGDASGDASDASSASNAGEKPDEKPGEKPRLSWRDMAWPLLLSAAALGAIAYFTFDPDAWRTIAARLDGWLLAAAGATVVARVIFGGWRLNYFSRGRLNFRQGLRCQLAWDFFAYVTPSTIGGGPLVSVFIARDQDLPLGESTSVILFSMLMDQFCFALTIPVLMGCAAAGLAVFPYTLGAVGYWTLVAFFGGFMLWVMVFAYGTLVRPRLLAGAVERLFRWAWLRRWREQALEATRDFEERSRVLRSQPSRFYAKGFVLTSVPWISRYLLALFVIWSVYPAVDKGLVFLRSAALNIGTLALPTPGGAGGAEGLYALFLGPPLVPEALVAPTLLVWRLLSYYLFIVVGLFITARYVQGALSSSSKAAAGSS